MVARHFYRFVEGDPVSEVPNVLRWGYRVTQQAEEGQAGSYEIIVSDKDMALDFVGHRRWIIYEDESDDDNEVLVDGIVQSVSIAHAGGDITNPEGRTWVVTVFDLNTLWTYRVMTGSDSQFPEQTDVERMQQLVDSEEMGYFDDVSLLSTDDPEDCDELNGRGRTPAQIADECAQDTGKNWWIDSIGTIAGGADIRVWYGADSSTAYTSPLSLSNDPADLDMPAVNDGTATVYPIGADTTLKRDYGRQYDGAYGEFQAGAKYISAAENPYAPGLTLSGRDLVTPAPEIKTRARMKRRLLRMLRDHATPDQVISTTITLPANKVTQLRAGMRVLFKATHEPGYEDFRYLRIMVATPRPVGLRYEVAVDLQGPGDEPPAPPWTCPLDAGISGTAAGFYPAMGSATTDSDGLVWYSSNNALYFADGWDFTDGPRPNTGTHGFGFPDYGTTGGDAAGTGVNSVVGFVFAGPGTIDVTMLPYGATNAAWDWQLYYLNGSGIVIQDQSANDAFDAGDSVSVPTGDLPGDALSCYRFFQISIGINIGGGGTKLVFPGIQWTPDA